MSTKTERLTRAVRWLQAYAALMTVALVVLFFRSGTEKDGVLRARELLNRCTSRDHDRLKPVSAPK